MRFGGGGRGGAECREQMTFAKDALVCPIVKNREGMEGGDERGTDSCMKLQMLKNRTFVK